MQRSVVAPACGSSKGSESGKYRAGGAKGGGGRRGEAVGLQAQGGRGLGHGRAADHELHVRLRVSYSGHGLDEHVEHAV